VNAWARAVVVVAAAIAAACGGSDPAPGDAADGTPSAAAPAVPANGAPWPSWGATPQPIAPATEAALRAAELDRDVTAAAVFDALDASDPAVQTRGAWALARIGGPAAATAFADRLGAGSSPLADGALAAIAALEPPAPVEGSLVVEPPWAELAERLWQHYAVSDQDARAVALLLAIARVGGASSQVRLGVDLSLTDLGDGSTERTVRALDAMAILCRRGFGLEAAPLSALSTALESRQADVRHAAAVALGGCAGPSAEQLAGPGRKTMTERLSSWVGSAEAEDAYAGWIGLAAIGEVPSEVPVAVLGTSPPPWRTEVAAVRALAANADGRTTLAQRLGQAELSGFEGPRWHVLLEALRQLRSSVDSTPELLTALAPLRDGIVGARKGASPRAHKALTLAGCELATLEAIVSTRVDALTGCAAGVPGIGAAHGEILAIDALTRMQASPTRTQALLSRSTDSRSAVAAAALSSLVEIDDPGVSAVLREALAGDDVGRISAAAGAIAGRSVDRQRRDPEAVAPLVAAIARLGNDAAVEARIAAIDALGNLARSASDAEADPATPAAQAESATPWLAQHVLPLSTDVNAAVRAAARRALAHDAALRERFDAATPASFPGAFSRKVHAAAEAGATVTELRLDTDAGALQIDVRGTTAPIARGSFASLAEAGYFDGLTFHRVVPDFVIQGGDPRGDGYGGPGYVMPCEWSNLRYERGTVGIALAGKDTGGSQLFITHGRPVHLDARYTIFGRITAGQDVVDAILPYDVIRSVKVERREP
jgi:cyclophilin family peptidyl-prolyl cis-trans isomerase